MTFEPPIPRALWDQVPPAAQAALTAVLLQYQQPIDALAGLSQMGVPGASAATPAADPVGEFDRAARGSGFRLPSGPAHKT